MVKGQASRISIGKLARQAGLRPSAIRYYEARGLLRPSMRLPNGYRLYDEDAAATLRFLRRAQGFGITLREIKQLIDLTQRGEQAVRTCPQTGYAASCRRGNADSRAGGFAKGASLSIAPSR
jgi:DNA-binding transcriptional MerR regulator